MLSPIWLLFLIPGVVSPLESPLHISLTGSVRAFYLMNFSIAALAFLLIFGCIICGLPICCVRHLGPQQNMGHRATHGKEIQTEPAKIAGAPWKRFLLDPFLTIIFLRVPAEFVFRVFFQHVQPSWSLGPGAPQENGIPNSQDWTYVVFSRVLWKRKRNSWLDPPKN